MYKLVIIDDELDVRSRLQSLIEKANKNFEIVGAYENGIEAYDGILSVMPDLIITDIKIPYVDGLETIKRVTEVLPLVKSIVITGFDEFDYAKQAANLGVLGFISKPISLADMNTILTKAENELNRDFYLSENIKQLEEFHQASLPLIRENNLCRLLTLNEVSETYQRKLLYDGIDLAYPYMLLAVVDVDYSDTDFEQYDNIFASIKKDFEEKKRDMDANVFMRSEKLYVLLKSHALFKLSEIERLFSALILKAQRLFSTSLSVGISQISEAPHNYNQMNINALISLEYRTIIGENKVFLFSNIQTTPNAGVKIDESEYKELIYTIKHKSEAEAQGKLMDLKSKISKSTSSASYRHFISIILNSIINSCNDLDALFMQYATYDDIYKRIFGLKNFDEVFISFAHLLTIAKRINDDGIRKNIDSNLSRILKYIEINYTSCDLCMETLSEETKLSISYISTLLKKENTSFVKFLTTLRMERAQELLSSSSYKIIEISEQLGYSDPYYFSHCFKKYTGISPKEYRANEEK